ARKPHVASDTIRRELTRIYAAFMTAEEMFPVELDGYEAPPIKRPKKQKRDGVARRTISAEEKDSIVKFLSDYRFPSRGWQVPDHTPLVMAGMFEFAWLLGLRYSEILGLLRRDFDRMPPRLRFRRFKTAEAATFEFLPDRAVEILAEMSDLSTTEFIFDLKLSTNAFEKILRQACEASGIPYGRKKTDGITFHSTRHSFTTRLVQVTDIATAASITGHSD